MVRIARWTLLLLAATCAAAAADKNQQTQTEPSQTCIAPEVVTNYEQQIATLESSNADATAQLTTATKEWKSEKKSLEAQLEKETTAHRSSMTLLRNTKAQSDATVARLEKKLEDAETAHRAELERLEAQVEKLEATVASTSSDLAAQAQIAMARDEDATATRATLKEYEEKVKALEKDVQQSHKRNEALKSELASKEEAEISLSALLSSYYDEGVVVASTTVAALREHAEQSSDTFTNVIDSLESTKRTVADSTDKFYSDNLAATVDPIIGGLRSAADPHVKKYLPIVQTEAEKARVEATRLSHEGLQRAKSVRLDAISLLEQNAGVRSHAQKIVDGVLLVVAIPLALLQFRVLLRLAWWLLSTAVCMLTCGCCCGRKRVKHASSADASASALATPSLTPSLKAKPAATTGSSSMGSQQKKKATTTTSTTTSSSSAMKRSGSKKNNSNR